MKLFPLRPMLWAAGSSVATVVFSVEGAAYSVPIATAVPLLLLLMIMVAWRVGFRASLTTAVVATLSLDYFFTLPKHTFEVASIADVVTLATFAATSTLVSHLSDRTRVKADQLQHAEEQQKLLYEFSRSALLIDWNGAVEAQLSNLIYERFRLTGVAIYTVEDQSVTVSGDVPAIEERINASFRSQRSYDLPNGAERLRILRFGSRAIGVLVLRGQVEAVVADTLATAVATHLVRTRSVRAEVRAQSQAFSESLRSTVLDGLAHAIKTPLTTIIVSSSGLREIGPLTDVQSGLANTIEEQAQHLTQVTNKLLQTAHLAGEDLRVTRSPVDLRVEYEHIRSEVQPRGDGDRIIGVDIPDEPFGTDRELLRLVLQQLLENALKYSPASSPVTLRFICLEQGLGISVHNQGSFIPPDERSLIFERYYRGTSTVHKASGTGIGLSAARSAVEAINGSIWVESSPEDGTTFHVSLPNAV